MEFVSPTIGVRTSENPATAFIDNMIGSDLRASSFFINGRVWKHKKDDTLLADICTRHAVVTQGEPTVSVSHRPVVGTDTVVSSRRSYAQFDELHHRVTVSDDSIRTLNTGNEWIILPSAMTLCVHPGLATALRFKTLSTDAGARFVAMKSVRIVLQLIHEPVLSTHPLIQELWVACVPLPVEEKVPTPSSSRSTQLGRIPISCCEVCITEAVRNANQLLVPLLGKRQVGFYIMHADT